MTGGADTGGIAWSDEGPETAPALVFLHALGADSRMWAAQAAAFAGRHRVIRFDLPGHGDSAPGPQIATVADYAGLALAVLDDRSVARAHLVGASLGGLVAVTAALIAPERVASLTLANTAARIGDPVAWNERIADIAERGLASLAPEIVGRWFAPAFAAAHGDRVAAMRDGLAAMRPADYTAGCLAVRDADLRGRLGAIAAPALVIAGAEDAATPPAATLALAGALPRGRGLTIAGAGHFAALEAPEAFNAALDAFLTEEAPA